MRGAGVPGRSYFAGLSTEDSSLLPRPSLTVPFLILAALLIVVSMMASRHAASRYQQAMARSRQSRAPYAHTGAEIARLFLKQEGVTDVEVLPHQGVVTDYFDPRRRRLFLSRRVHDETTLSAWAVALHEAAHALQTRESAGELNWRQTIIRLNRYTPTFMAILLVVMTVMKVVPARIAILMFALVWAGLFALNAGTLAVEWNANLRLRRFLDEHLASYPDAREQLDRVLSTVATRELGDTSDSLRYFFLSALPGSGKLRPTETRPPPEKPE